MKRYPTPILILALLFTLKALYLAFFVTPLWDIPDEIGHYSYARDLAEGRGVPVLGRAEIGGDVMAHVSHNPDARPAANWIAQHPPVYYLLSAVPLKIGMAFTNDPEVLYRLPRLVAAICGGLLLLVLFRTMRTLGLDNYRATVLAACIGFIPMVSHLASGTNHDMTLFLFSALMVHFLVRFLINHQLRDAYWSAAWMTLAAGIKMTAWVIIPLLIVIIALEFSGPVRHWLKHLSGVTAVMLLIPLAWMLRNLVYFGDPTYTTVTNAIWRMDTPLTESFYTYIHSQPVIDHFILNFYGLLGWIGTGGGKLNWFQVAGAPRAAFSLILFATGLLINVSLLITLWQAFRIRTGFFTERVSRPGIVKWLSSTPVKAGLLASGLVVAMVGAVTICIGSHPAPHPMGEARILYAALLVFAGMVALVPLLYVTEPLDRLMLYALVVFLFFTAVMMWQVYGIYLLDGRMRATHGRYFYPVVPFMLVALAVSVYRLRIPGLLLAVLTAGLAIMELETFVLQALPFYDSVVR